MRFFFILFVVFAAAPAIAAGDAVFRYVDDEGVVHYTDRAPDRNAKPLNLGPGATPRPTRRQIFYTPDMLREAARFAVRIESPTPGERFAADAVPAVAAASVMPGLVRGFRLIYQMDGNSVTAKPVGELSIALTSLSAGPHELQVVLLDPAGREVARSVVHHFEVQNVPARNSAPKR